MAGVLAILFGVLGVHKFYLGYSGQGALLLVLFILGIPLMFLFGIGIIVWIVLGIIGLVEGIIYLTKPDVNSKRPTSRAASPGFEDDQAIPMSPPPSHSLTIPRTPAFPMCHPCEARLTKYGLSKGAGLSTLT